jgi:hypothetical protein
MYKFEEAIFLCSEDQVESKRLLQAKDHRRLGNEKQKITRKGDETDA